MPSWEEDMDKLRAKYLGADKKEEAPKGPRIIKEFQVSSYKPRRGPAVETTTVFLRAEKADMSLKTLTAIFNEAQKDFPGLKEEDVTLTLFKKPVSETVRSGRADTSAPALATTGPVAYDGIQFEVKTQPPAGYTKLRPTGYAQG